MKKVLAIFLCAGLLFAYVGVAGAVVLDFEDIKDPPLGNFLSTDPLDPFIYNDLKWVFWTVDDPLDIPGDNVLGAPFGFALTVTAIAFPFDLKGAEFATDTAGGGSLQIFGSDIDGFDIPGYIETIALAENTLVPHTLNWSGLGALTFLGSTTFYMDNFDFTPVPEPGTMFLLGSGIIGLAGFRRKFRKR